MTPTLVLGGAAGLASAAAPATPSKRARRPVRTRDRRSLLLISVTSTDRWVDAGIAGFGPAIWGLSLNRPPCCRPRRAKTAAARDARPFAPFSAYSRRARG